MRSGGRILIVIISTMLGTSGCTYSISQLFKRINILKVFDPPSSALSQLKQEQKNKDSEIIFIRDTTIIAEKAQENIIVSKTSYDNISTLQPTRQDILTSSTDIQKRKNQQMAILNQEIYNLKGLEKLTLVRDVTIRAARQRLKEANSHLYEVESSYGLEFGPRYTYFPTSGNDLGEGEIDTEHRLSLRLSQDLISLLKIKPGRINEMKAEVEGAEAELKDVARNALYTLRVKYLEMLEEKIRADSYLRLKDIYQNLFRLWKKRYQYKEALLGDVLEAENFLIEAKDLFLYHQANYERKKSLLAESLGIRTNQIQIENVEFLHPLPSEEKLMNSAIKRRGEIERIQANAKQERVRGETLPYEEIRLSTHLGYRLREDRTSGLEVGPEIGFVFSIPLGFKNIKDHRVNRFKAKENYWKLEAERISQDIKKDIRNAYERYLQQNIRLLKAEKGKKLKNEEMRVEQTILQNGVRTIKADPANVLKMESDIKILNLEEEIAKCERNKSYYELLYLAGFAWPEELSAYHLETDALDRKPHERALWVWRVKEFLGDEQSEAFFESFCKTKDIKRVFFSLNKTLLDSLPKNSELPKFISQLHQAGIRVSALLGGNLCIYPRNRKNLKGRIQSVITYNSSSRENARFDSIHLDIEPHTLKEWNNEKKQLLNLLIETYIEAKQMVMTDQSKLQLEVDIPTFYDKVDPFILKRIAEVADVITVMAYERKTAEKIIKSVNAELQAAVGNNKGIIVGLNAKDFMDEAKLEILISDVGSVLSTSPSFLGFSIHDFNGYRTLAGR